MVGDRLRIFPIWLTSSRELGIIITCNTGVVDQQLDTLGLFCANLLVKTLNILWVTCLC